MAKLKWIAIAFVAVFAGYVAYLVLFPSATLRYRLTVDIEADGAIHSGSSVIEISYNPTPWLLSGGLQFPGKLQRGYAVTADLGRHGLLFVVDEGPVLKSPDVSKGFSLYPRGANLATLPLVLYGYPRDGGSEMLSIVRNLQDERKLLDVPLDLMPMMLRFRDLNDRNSNEEVDPRNLAAVLGDGVRVTKATLQITDDQITPMPSTWPSWLVNEHGQEGFLVNAYNGQTYREVWCSAGVFKGER